LVPKLVTLNDHERRNVRYFVLLRRMRTPLKATIYVKLIEGRPTCLQR